MALPRGSMTLGDGTIVSARRQLSSTRGAVVSPGGFNESHSAERCGEGERRSPVQRGTVISALRSLTFVRSPTSAHRVGRSALRPVKSSRRSVKSRHQAHRSRVRETRSPPRPFNFVARTVRLPVRRVRSRVQRERLARRNGKVLSTLRTVGTHRERRTHARRQIISADGMGASMARRARERIEERSSLQTPRSRASFGTITSSV
jgi:hypothetical protein